MVSYKWMLNKEYDVVEDSFVGLRGEDVYVHVINNFHGIARVVIQ